MIKFLFLSILLITNSVIAQVAMNASNVLSFNIVLNDSETFVIPDGKTVVIKNILFNSASTFGELRINSKVVIQNSSQGSFQSVSIYAGQADVIRFVGNQNSITLNGLLLSDLSNSVQHAELKNDQFRVLQDALGCKNLTLERSECSSSETFYIKNIEGKELKSFVFSDCRYSMDCSSFSNGTYLVGNGKSFLKFVLAN
jgi:hypothetical protein